METEIVELKTLSTFDPAGIDAAIEKYERLEAMHEKLSALKISVDASGFTQLNRELVEVDATIGRISAKRGFDSINRQIEENMNLLRQQRTAYQEAGEAFMGTNYFRGRTVEEGNAAQGAERRKLDAMQAAIAAREADMDKLFEERRKVGATAFAAPAAAAPTGQVEMTDAARKMAEAEAKLTAPAREAASALEKQEAISRRKTAATKETAGAVKQLSEAERGLKGQIEGAAQAQGEAGRLYARTNAEGETVEEKYQVSPSETMIRRGEDTITTHRDLAIAAQQAADAERNWRTQMAAAGSDMEERLQFSREYVESLREQRAALGGAYEGAPEVQSIDTKIGRGEAAAAAAQARLDAAQKEAEARAEEERMTAQQRVLKIEEQQAARQAQARQQAAQRQTQTELTEIGKRERAQETADQAAQRKRDAAFVKEFRDRESAAAEASAHYDTLSRAAAAKSGVTLGPDAELTRRSSATSSEGERTSSSVWQQMNGSMKETVTIFERYNAAGELVEHQTRRMESAVKDLGSTGDWSARSFLHNTFVVTAWAASVGTLYSALGALRSGAEAAVDIERKFGTLETVFKGSREEALGLRDSVLQLAASEGRSTDEAMDAATRFSRLGLSEVDVIEATTQALKASNIAQISTAESAQYLSAIMVGYGLHAKDLGVVLNQLNAIAISYNVTNSDMLEGISRVSALAQRAKLPLTELAGLIGAGVGATGRPGSEFGNAIKAVITSINTPSKQNKLESDYGLQVKTQGDDLKDFSQILGELYVRYQQLTGAQQASLLQVIGQRQQGARLATLLDNYVQSQVLAIRAQTDMNSAERENANIRATMSSQLETLRSEFERLSVNMVASGENLSVSNGIQEVLKLLSNAMTILADHPTTVSVMVGLLAMMAAKVVLVAVSMDDAGKKGNFFLNTIRQITLAVRTMGTAMEQANAETAASGGLWQVAGEKMEAGMTGMIAGVGGLATAGKTLMNIGKFLLGTLVDLIEYVPQIALIAAGIWAVNKAFDYFEGSAQKATDAAAGFNDEIERATNLSNAAAQSARLMETIEQAAPHLDEKGFQKAAAGVAEIAFPSAAEDDKRQALEEELEAMRQQGRYGEIQAKLEEMKKGYLADANVERQKELDLTRRQLANEQEEAAQLERMIQYKDQAGKPADDLRLQLRDVENRINTLTQKGMQDVGDEMDDESDEEQEDPASKLADARAKGIQKGFDDFSEKVEAGDTASDKLKEEIQLLDAKKAALDANTASTQQGADAARDAAQAQVDAARKALDAAHNPHLDAVMNVLQQRTGRISQGDADAMARRATTAGTNEMEGARDLGPASMRSLFDDTLAGPGDDAEYGAQPGRYEQEHARYFGTLKSRQAALDDAGNALDKVNQTLGKNAEATKAANDKAKEAIDLDREAAEAQLKYADAIDRADDASRTAKNVALTGKFGANSGEEIFNQAQATFGSLRKDYTDELAARESQGNTQEGLLDQVQTEATIREKLKELRESELSAAQRQAEIEGQIRQEMEKQNEAASQALMMGSRQEQMQATMIARYLQQRGGKGFSTNEFMFFDQETREAIMKFFPSAAPIQAQSDIGKLLQERNEMPGMIDRLRQENAAAQGLFGDVNPDATAARYAGLDKVGAAQPPVPEMAVNVGGVKIDIGDQFTKLTTQFQNVVAQQIRPQLDKMSDRISALERANAVTNAGARA